MNTAVISLTESGRLLSRRICEQSGDGTFTRYCSVRHCDDGAVPFEALGGLVGEIFGRYDALVFVCAVGIAVRVCAPCMVSKLTDPAVVAVDDGGRFAVSVLSGHLGGANALAERIASAINAVPVVTTATDAHGLFSPDMFAKANDLVICDMSAAKLVAAAVVNGDRVGFMCEYPHSELPACLYGVSASDASPDCEAEKYGGAEIGICVSAKAVSKPFSVTLHLLPRNIVVGIGCKKGTSAAAIEAHVKSVFDGNGLDMRRIRAAATIDIKAQEAGLLQFCGERGIKLLTYPAGTLMKAEGDFSHSDFVEKTTGADNVCERAAACAGGRTVVRKTAGNGVTVAVAELPVYIDLERKND